MTYLMNAWYMAGWSGEVESGALVRRILLERPVLLWRDRAGVAHAMEDRCPHRQVPLSRGAHLGDAIQCGYHGLQFGADGQCIHNPQGEGRIPGQSTARTFPLVERHGALWFWPGAIEAADPSRIPDHSFQDPETAHVGRRYLHVKANYLLEVDNIMDLSHIQFLHPTTLGSGDVSQGVYEALVDGETVWSKRRTTAEIMPDFLYAAMGIPHGTPTDRWIDVHWSAPSTMIIYAGGVPTGAVRQPGDGVAQAHVFTPETARTSHYWFSIAFPKAMGPHGAQIAEAQIEGLKAPFELEDLPMLEAQQDNLGDTDIASLRTALLAGDAGGQLARRVLSRLMAAEQAASSGGAPQGS